MYSHKPLLIEWISEIFHLSVCQAVRDYVRLFNSTCMLEVNSFLARHLAGSSWDFLATARGHRMLGTKLMFNIEASN